MSKKIIEVTIDDDIALIDRDDISIVKPYKPIFTVTDFSTTEKINCLQYNSCIITKSNQIIVSNDTVKTIKQKWYGGRKCQCKTK